MKIFLSFLILTLTFSTALNAAEKGLLPEIRSRSGSEEENQMNAMKTEIMITKTENEAIAQLQKIIAKRKGSSDEPSLWYRLGELYMRRAKSGRFFDLYRQDEKAVSFVPPVIREQSAVKHLTEAVKIFDKIEKQWPRFEDLDSVLFNSGFSLQQLGKRAEAEKQYLKIVKQFSNSPLLPDTQLALGEMNYEQQRFNVALSHFQEIEKYPNARVYAYGVYKAAWTLYNLKKNEEAIEKLIQVVKFFDPNKPKVTKVNHNLRTEAIHDLALIFEDVHPAEKAYSFFNEICTGEEISDAMMNLGKLYQAHSRFKELNIFLAEFTQKQPLSSERIRAHMMRADSLEMLKDREKVVKELEEMARLCAADSTYRKGNEKSSIEHCDYDFARQNVEFAKKWWDLWLKQKQNKQLASYTLKAFEIHLNREDRSKPDVKSRYAYSELNYQLENYREAARQYELTSDYAVDTAIKHDSTYSAIVALEKGIVKKSEKTDQDDQLRLLSKYLERYPTGTHHYQVRFKAGFIHYEKRNYPDADKWLRALALDQKSGEFKRKSEDLVLDIMNALKNYSGIRDFAQGLLKEKPEQVRQTALNKLIVESEYALIQEFAKTGDKIQTAQKLFQFFQNHKDSSLAKDALWQGLSLFYSAGRSVDGADLSLIFVQNYPNEGKNKDALKEAAKAYSESGLLLNAANTLMKVVELVEGKEQRPLLEAASELYLLEGKNVEARKILQKLLAGQNKEEQAKIYAQILQTLKGQENSKEYQALEAHFIAQNIEPYASLLQVKKVETLYQNEKFAEAFSAAKPIVGGEGSDEAKARARLIQAQVLERELIAQSTKTSLEKLAVVLSMKTEKLDKAQTAFLSAAKISTNPDIQVKALTGLQRIYQNYVEAVANPIVKTEMTEEEKKALQNELKALIKPIQEKKSEIDSRLQNLAKESKALATSVQLDYSSVPETQTIKPSILAFRGDLMPLFLPEEFTVSEKSSHEASQLGKKEKCQSSETADIASLNRCLLLKNTGAAYQLTENLVRQAPKKAVGLFYLSVIAYQEQKYSKAQHLLSMALKQEPKHPVLHYQNALQLQAMANQSQANAEFIQAKKLGLRLKELHVIGGLLSYSQGDYLTAIAQFDELSQKSLRPFALATIYAESVAMAGDADKALRILNREIEENKNQPDLYLELARLYEDFKFDKSEAIKSYELAGKYTSDSSLKNWTKRKIDFLSQTNKVTALNPQHVSTKDSSLGNQVGGNQ